MGGEGKKRKEKKSKRLAGLLPTPAPLLGPLPCREEQEDSRHPFLKEDVSTPLPLRKDQAALLGAAGAEQSLRRLRQGEGLPALPQRGKWGPLKRVWVSGGAEGTSSAHAAPGEAIE